MTKRFTVLFFAGILILTTSFSAFALQKDLEVDTSFYTPVQRQLNSDIGYSLIMDAPEDYTPGENIYVEIYLRDIVAESGFGFVHFYLYFDSQKVIPLVLNNFENNNQNMEDFLVLAPDLAKWEGICKLEEEESRYNISFMTTDKSAHAKADDEVVIKIGFEAKSTATGEIDFVLPGEESFCADYSLNKYYGLGDRATVTETEDSFDPGIEPEDPVYLLEITGDEHYVPGEIYTARITLKDITVTDGFVIISFYFYYDPNKTEPIIKNNPDTLNSEISDLLINAPDMSAWEGICSLREDLNRYELSYLTVYHSTAKQDGDIIIEIPFLINQEAKGDIMFYIPHDETSAYDYSLDEYPGLGSSILVSELPEACELSLKDTNELILDRQQGFLLGITPGTTVSDLLDMFEGEVVLLDEDGKSVPPDRVVGTGFIVQNKVESLRVILLGDGNGDGVVDAKDYLLTKRIILGNLTLSPYRLAAICIEGKSTPTSKDYVLIKRHFLGSYDLHAPLSN